MSKAIEFTIPRSQLTQFENVKNFTYIDGSNISFIETSAYVLCQIAHDECKGALHKQLEVNGDLKAVHTELLKQAKELRDTLLYYNPHSKVGNNPKCECKSCETLTNFNKYLKEQG